MTSAVAIISSYPRLSYHIEQETTNLQDQTTCQRDQARWNGK